MYCVYGMELQHLFLPEIENLYLSGHLSFENKDLANN